MKAADVPEADVLRLVEEHDDGGGAHKRWLAEGLPQFPPKVVYAKANKLVRRGVLSGCTCGCGGWYSIPAALRSDQGDK